MRLRVACVGAGWVTRNRHLPALNAEKRVEVVGVVDSDGQRAAAAAADVGAEHSGTSFDAEWLDAVDCVTIGTPPLSHAVVIGAALERGWHCLCEKPLAWPASKGTELARVADGAGLVLAVMHNFQFSRSGSRLFHLVETGRLGSIESVHGFQLSNPRRRLPEWYQALPGGLFLDEAAHLLYLLRRVLGQLEPRTVDARLDGSEVREVVATFDHETIWATLSMGFRASISEWQLIVVGTDAVAALDIFRDILIVVPNDGSHRAREILRSSIRVVSAHSAGVVTSGLRTVGRRLRYGTDEVVGRFVDAVEGRRDRLRWISGEDGAAVASCLEDLLVRSGIDPRS
jgi:scyllo-inositol 2-dehydrogenase (NADP+)